MKGGITWNEVWSMSPEQRHKVAKFLTQQHKEQAKALTGQEYM